VKKGALLMCALALSACRANEESTISKVVELVETSLAESSCGSPVAEYRKVVVLAHQGEYSVCGQVESEGQSATSGNFQRFVSRVDSSKDNLIYQFGKIEGSSSDFQKVWTDNCGYLAN